MIKKIYPLKLDKVDKLIYVFQEIIDQKQEFGRHIPIKVLKKVFEKDIYYGITPKEVEETISILDKAGVISLSRGGASIEAL